MRPLSLPLTLSLSLGAAASLCAPAHAQDATRGAAIYRQLPGQPAVGSCISCHGEPVNNRNSVLRGAVGGEVISRTIAAVSRMGYLRQYLGDPDFADISAYLATVVPAGPVDSLPAPWPTADDFGAHAVGTQSPPRDLLIRNLQPRSEVAVAAVLSSDPAAFPVQHDCPLSLPPLGQCRATAWFRPQRQGPADATFSIVDSGGRVLRSGTLAGSGVAEQPARLEWTPAGVGLVDFGRVAAGDVGRQTLTLRNGSATAVTLQTLRATGPNAARFTLSAPCGQAGRIEAGASCTLALEFAPTRADQAEGWVEIGSDASNAPLVRMAGIGTPAPVASPAASAADDEGSSQGGGGALAPAWLAWLLAAVVALRLLRRP